MKLIVSGELLKHINCEKLQKNVIMQFIKCELKLETDVTHTNILNNFDIDSKGQLYAEYKGYKYKIEIDKLIEKFKSVRDLKILCEDYDNKSLYYDALYQIQKYFKDINENIPYQKLIIHDDLINLLNTINENYDFQIIKLALQEINNGPVISSSKSNQVEFNFINNQVKSIYKKEWVICGLSHFFSKFKSIRKLYNENEDLIYEEIDKINNAIKSIKK